MLLSFMVSPLCELLVGWLNEAFAGQFAQAPIVLALQPDHTLCLYLAGLSFAGLSAFFLGHTIYTYFMCLMLVFTNV